MTYSRQPWSARTTVKPVVDEEMVWKVSDVTNADMTREVHELLDADGRVIATFTDARDMDLVTGGFPTRAEMDELRDELKDALAERVD